MKRYVIALLLMVGVGLYMQQAPAGQEGGGRGISPEMKAELAKQEELEKNTPKIAVSEEILALRVPGHTIGETEGVDTDSKGNLYVHTRSGKAGISRGATASQLFSFDSSLKYQREWCEDCYAESFAHAVRVDKDDNVWMVDEGSNMIVKMDQTGLVKMVLGRKPEAIDYLERFLELGEHITPEQNRPSTGRMGTFGRPTDVDWDAAGNIYVSDGYANSRTVKISKDGVWLKTFGTRGSGPNQFNTVHSIATDAKGLVYVADRGNRRIYVLDSELNVVRMITGMGQPWSVAITPGATQYLWTGDSAGKMFKFTLDGKLLGWNLTTQGQGQNSCLVHSLSPQSENVLYKGDCTTWHVEKLTFKP